MSKIVLAVNSMISNADKISNVTQDAMETEYLFEYDNKYIWGILESNGQYSLYFYPNAKEVNELTDIIDWESVPMVTYNTTELKTREALDSFIELYLIVKEKLHDVEEVLDDIIGNL